jgi:hypothetical protein
VLDAAHRRAVATLERASARRSQVLAEQDRLVAVAQGEVDATVATMVAEIGPDLTALLVGVNSSKVRRVARAGHPSHAQPGYRV